MTEANSNLNVNGHRQQIAAQLKAVAEYIARDEFQHLSDTERALYHERLAHLNAVLALTDTTALLPR
jgi:hypothetical protein